MNLTSKLLCTVGLLATGGEVITHGDERVKKIAEPLWKDMRPDRGIREVPLSELDELPQGVARVER